MFSIFNLEQKLAMNIAIIGTGNIGGSLAKAWMKNGHQIFLGTRNPLSTAVRGLVHLNEDLISAHAPEVAASKADIILLAVPADAAFKVAKSLGNTDGKIFIDAMNAIFRKPEGFETTYEAVFKGSGNNHIVKAFNMIGAENIDNPIYQNDCADMFICGEFNLDKEIVLQLVKDAGFRGFDIGGIEMEPALEHLALIWGKLAFQAKLGRNIAFKVLER